ncbi:MAG: YeeE/YedE thiosulfate transporter family protein [Gemmatimonadota bacterium]
MTTPVQPRLDSPGSTARQRGYSHPIAAGVGLGLVLFATIMIAGQGLGASGAFASSAAAAVHAVAPDHARAHPYVARWIPGGPGGLLGDWLVLELVGVVAGAWLSARLAGRARRGVERIGSETRRGRLAAALVGGGLMGAGARLARGCTSGLGLTGGALLATGAWLFIPVAFGTGFVVAWLRRRLTQAPAGSPA